MEEAGCPGHVVGHMKPPLPLAVSLTPKARTMSSNDSSLGSLDAEEPTGCEAQLVGRGAVRAALHLPSWETRPECP